ncbi:ExbD/TolR family protein [Solidesulfovibrio sp.]|uniref:ExbD/TolR family protein n=1 Tax=Solidesulfovibrio sp. TaxID=2910990 RepID=UPI002B2002E4|nr:ExbD/TolR family protein [Solidesulfovibrio sp.]MEA5088604.1 ExbD/TolR family protein [Solidesulfovibrio sp.]
MGASPGNGLMAEMNVTPFVDVMLVLLVIFMVTVPMMTEGMDVDLPQSGSLETLSLDEGAVLTLRADGSLYLDTQQVPEEVLPEALAKRGAGVPLFLKADREVPHGRVVEIMGLVRAAGIQRFGVVAESSTAQGRN